MTETPFDYSFEEQESFVHWDYAGHQLIFQTTKRHVFQHWLKATNAIEGRKVGLNTIIVPLEAARKPTSVLRKPRKAKSPLLQVEGGVV